MTDPLNPVRRGAIVSCRFPHAETPDQPGPAARPALVVGTFTDPRDGALKAVVAYGTSRDTRSNAGFELRVRHPDALKAAGLHRPTRFTLSRMRILPVDSAFFANSKEGTPVLGYLDDRQVANLDTHCERLAAISDELRTLLRAGKSATRPAAEPQGLSLAQADAYLQRTCTGRATVAGTTDPASSGPVVVERKRRVGARHLGRRRFG